MSVKDVKGVGAKTAEKLENNGINTLKSLAMSSENVLVDDIGIGEGTAKKILKNARNQLETHGTGFSPGDAMEEKEKELGKIHTGSNKIDDLLGGGVPVGYITELYGENSSGKSQLATTLAATVQLPEEEGGMDKGAVYIDTEGAFMPGRLREIAEERGMDGDEALSNVFISKTIDTNDLQDKVEQAKNLCSQEDIGLVIVDSIMGPFRAEYSGRNELTERQNALGDVILSLKELIRTQDVAICYTNQVYEDPGEMFGDAITPAGGKVLGHNSSFRVYLQDRQSKGWAAKLTDSPGLPQKEVRFDIDASGVKDKE